MTRRQRIYLVTFRNANTGREIECEVACNIRSTAERQARRSLRDEHGVDPRDYFTVSVEPLRKSE